MKKQFFGVAFLSWMYGSLSLGNPPVRIAEVYTSPKFPQVIAVVEEYDSEDKLWYRTAGKGGIYFGDPATGTLHRLVALPKTSSSNTDGESHWVYRVKLAQLGKEAEIEVRVAKEGQSQSGQLLFSCKGASECLRLDTTETKLWEAQRGQEKLKLTIEPAHVVRHAFRNPTTGHFLVIDSTSLEPSSLAGVEVFEGQKGALKRIPIKHVNLTEPSGKGRPQAIISHEEIPNYESSDSPERTIGNSTAQIGKFTVRIELEDGRILLIPGPTDHNSLPKITKGKTETFLEPVEKAPEVLFTVGYDMSRILPKDYDVCKIVLGILGNK